MSLNKRNTRAEQSARGSRKSAPVAMSTSRRMHRPLVRQGERSVRIRHREFVGDVPGSDSFDVKSYSINPGLPSLYAWLSRIASRYEKYRFLYLAFSYETSTSTATTGTVMTAVDYDASDLPPASKQTLLSFAGAVRSAPWVNSHLDCDKSRLRGTRFVRSGAVQSGTDVKLYDLGNFLLARQGQDSETGEIGELYVEYDVELTIPTAEAACPGGRFDSGGTVSTSSLLGTAPVLSGPVPAHANNAGSGLIFDQPGEFLISVQATGSGIVFDLYGSSTSVDYSIVQASTVSQLIGITVYRVRAVQGDTMYWDMTGSTTLTSSILCIASAGYADLD